MIPCEASSVAFDTDTGSVHCTFELGHRRLRTRLDVVLMYRDTVTQSFSIQAPTALSVLLPTNPQALPETLRLVGELPATNIYPGMPTACLGDASISCGRVLPVH